MNGHIVQKILSSFLQLRRHRNMALLDSIHNPFLPPFPAQHGNYSSHPTYPPYLSSAHLIFFFPLRLFFFLPPLSGQTDRQILFRDGFPFLKIPNPKSEIRNPGFCGPWMG